MAKAAVPGGKKGEGVLAQMVACADDGRWHGASGDDQGSLRRRDGMYAMIELRVDTRCVLVTRA